MRSSLAAWLLALLVLSPAPVEAQEAEALSLDGGTSIDYPGLRELDHANGTIELWLAAQWEEDLDYHPCALALRDAAGATRYSIHVGGDRSEIGMWNGEKWATVPADLSDGKYHRIVVVTGDAPRELRGGKIVKARGKQSEVMLDGVSVGTLPMGYGGGRGLPLHVGSGDGASEFFIGSLWSLRVFNRDLPESILEDLAGNTGGLEDSHPAAKHLVAISSFTTEAKEIYFPISAAAEAATQVADAEEGEIDPSLPTRPEPDEADAGPDYTGAWVERDTRTFRKKRRDDVPDGNHGSYETYPVFLLEKGAASEARVAGEMVGGDRGRPFKARVPDGGRALALLVGAGEASIDSLQLVVASARGSSKNLPRVGARSGAMKPFNLERDETIIGLSGSAGEQLHSLRIHTDARVSELYGDGSQGEEFARWVPHGATFAGLVGRSGKNIRALALEYTATAEGLDLISEDSRKSFAPTGPGTFKGRKAELRFEGDDIFVLEGTYYERVPAYEQIEERVGYGDLMGVNNQLHNADYSFRGYDVPYLDPWDYKQSGPRDYVFSFPNETSTEWYVRNKVVIPNGLEMVSEDRGSTKIETSTSFDESKFNESLGRTLNLGAGGGVFKAFTWNEDYTNKVDEMYNEEKSLTQGTADLASYSLVLDYARMKLDPKFRKRVEQLAKSKDYKGFIKSFGTHYPNAITYGGRGIQEIEMTKSTYEKMVSEDVKIEMDALGTTIASAVGGKAPSFDDYFSGSSNMEDSLKRELSDQVENFRFIGGSGGFGKDSWQVGEKPTPIYLDLMPLDRLLAPPHFSDGAITGKLRQGLKQAIEKYLASAPEPRTKSVKPMVFEIAVDQVQCLTAGEIDRIAEVQGLIEVRGFGKRGKEKPGNVVAFSRAGDDHVSIREGQSHNLKSSPNPGEKSRRVFALSEEELKTGYAIIEAQLSEWSDGAKTPLGKKKSNKLYFKTMKTGKPRSGSLKFKKPGCSGRMCPVMQVNYHYSRLE